MYEINFLKFFFMVPSVGQIVNYQLLRVQLLRQNYENILNQIKNVNKSSSEKNDGTKSK